MEQQLQDLLSRLTGVKPGQQERQWSARCPAHDDQHASLSVAQGDDGKVLLRCHAGCQTEAIVAALGLHMRDLFPRQESHLVAAYDYHDATGKLLFQTLRYQPKDFRQRQPNGQGGWRWHLKGVPRVLYRLPQLLAADPADLVCIAEGEKDVDALATLGLLATTNPMGAGKWKLLADDSVLNGRHVAIFQDDDDPGQAHARDVAQRLCGRAAEVRILSAPEGHKDVAAWVAAHSDCSPAQLRQQLLAAVAAAPLFLPPPAPELADNAGNDEMVDPGPIPEELLRVPGFVAEVMDLCLRTAPYPNVALAFCGALALQAFLAGRKVRDQADNRTNLYLLGLAYSSVGKDWPRKVNTCLLHQVGLVHALGEKFASGEGLQDALFLTPAMLFQTDEIDTLLQAINKARDARHENILSTLLTMYSAANSIYPMRRKAGQETPGVIDQPCLVVYGTAIPTHYYEALSERLLTNGFFARTIIVESGPRSTGQEPGIIEPSPRLLDTARWWADFRPGSGNLTSWHPQPHIVAADSAAVQLLAETRQACEAEYASAESRADAVGTTVWGRLPEQVRKLALLYAVSRDHLQPHIDVAAVRWASALVLHQARRMLFMAQSHAGANPFHTDCLRLVRKLREAPEQQLSHSVLLKRMKIDTKTFQELIDTLVQQGDVVEVPQATGGRPQRFYRFVGGG